MLCEVSDQSEIMRICTEAMGFARIDVGVLIGMLPTIERDIEELAEVLKIDVIPSNVYTLIAETVQNALCEGQEA